MLWIAIGLIVAGIVLELVKRRLDRSLAELDELQARAACRPVGNVDRV